jgi:hypothetical protein
LTSIGLGVAGRNGVVWYPARSAHAGEANSFPTAGLIAGGGIVLVLGIVPWNAFANSRKKSKR